MELLTESLLLADGQEHELTPRFYDILFERHPEMYGWVAESMIPAMTELGGEQWTPAMTDAWTDAWTEALGAVAGLMQAGA